MKRSLLLPVLSSLALATVGLAGCASSGSGSTAPPSAVGTATPPAAVRSQPATSSPSGPAAVQSQAPVAAESNPPGDIPDNLAFVPYRNPAGRYSFTHPEGWAQTGSGTAVLFTDKLNGVSADVGPLTSAPTVAQAQQRDVPALQSSQPAFELRDVTEVNGSYGSGVRIVYRRNSAADPVTGRQYRDEVERYEVVSNGREVVMELFGPVGADNVDAYRTMIDSLAIR